MTRDTATFTLAVTGDQYAISAFEEQVRDLGRAGEVDVTIEDCEVGEASRGVVLCDGCWHIDAGAQPGEDCFYCEGAFKLYRPVGEGENQ